MFRSIGSFPIWDKTTSSSLKTTSLRFISSVDSTNNEDFYATLLGRLTEARDFDHGRALHAKLLTGPLHDSLFLSNHVINMYAKCGQLHHAHNVFDHMPHRNTVSWTALMSGFVQHNQHRDALALFSRMHAAGVKLSEFTLVTAMHACSLRDNDNAEEGHHCSYDYFSRLNQVHAFVVRSGFQRNVFLMNVLVTALIRGGQLEWALKVFEGSRKDTVSWNSVMTGLGQFRCGDVPRFWRRMLREGVKPDGFTFSCVLSQMAAVGDGGMGVQVHGQLVKCGHGHEVPVGNSLVDMYVKCGSLENGTRAFKEMAERDLSTWNQMAAGFVNWGKPLQALEIIEEMRRSGTRINKFALATALTACANVACLEEGKKAHTLRIKLGNDNVDGAVDNALLDMYAKCGSMDDALLVFETMNDDPSVISWTTMVMGFSQNGEARKALEFFNEMRAQNVGPNYITFIGVLHACSQAGLISEGWEYFSSMERDHGLSAGEDHCACMVDMLGRAGQIEEAYELIMKMPIQPGVLVWQTLLGACRAHGDMATGLLAAEQAFSLEKGDSSIYAVLSNMFASERNWKGAGSLRELMETRDVKKMPGSSWIQLTGS